MEKPNFEADKQLLLIKIEALRKEFGELTKQVAPKHWRTTGTLYSNLHKMEHDLKEFTEISKEDLKLPWVRKELGIKEECPACFGAGYEDGGGDYANEKCLVCNGTGKG